MKKSVLIAGKSSNLLEELANSYLNAGYNVAISSEEEEKRTPEESETLLRFQVNRRSPLSNRSFIMKAVSQFGKIDEAVVVFTTEGENRPLHELPAASIEVPVDNSIKGVFFILKELFSYFYKMEGGAIALASYTYGLEALTPVDAAVHGSFKGIADSLFTYYKNEMININGFESSSGEMKEFADFIRATMREKGSRTHGRWFRFADRGGLFSNLPKPGKKR